MEKIESIIPTLTMAAVLAVASYYATKTVAQVHFWRDADGIQHVEAQGHVRRVLDLYRQSDAIEADLMAEMARAAGGAQ